MRRWYAGDELFASAVTLHETPSGAIGGAAYATL